MKLKDYLLSKNISQGKFSKIVGIPQPTICHWANNLRPVPAHQCIKIEAATEGQVGRKDLRSDWFSIWPELARDSTLSK